MGSRYWHEGPRFDGQSSEAGKYGGGKGPSLWAGKAVALLITHGYPPEKGRGLFQGGVRRCCKYPGLRHPGYDAPFMDEEKELRTRKFAGELLKIL